jgi:glycerophosphoryl diester phosphodiesterase
MAAESHRRKVWQGPFGQPGSGGPLLLGHRGASAHLTENTLAAFQRAMADGADGVELDVQRCRTGEIVVFHDDDLVRLAGRPERITELSLATLREVRLRGGGRIPTLAETFEACGPDALVNVEIKAEGYLPASCAALVAGVSEVIARAGAGSRVLVSSFNPAAIWLWRRHHGQVPSGLLFERPRPFHRPWPLHTDWLLPALRPSAVHPDHVLCTAQAVRRWHRRGYAVNVWTVDEPGRLQILAEMGVDALITNDPAAARSALRLTLRSAGG